MPNDAAIATLRKNAETCKANKILMYADPVVVLAVLDELDRFKAVAVDANHLLMMADDAWEPEDHEARERVLRAALDAAKGKTQ